MTNLLFELSSLTGCSKNRVLSVMVKYSNSDFLLVTPAATNELVHIVRAGYSNVFIKYIALLIVK